MIPAPLPENEEARLETLRRYKILDTPPEEAFNRITRLLARAIGVPITLVSLVDKDRQWFKSSFGIDATETPRDQAFCAHAILGDDVFVVEDATLDQRFHDNPLVREDPSIRFYAGAPLTTSTGYKLGTLCAIDRAPRNMTAEQQQLLKDLAGLIIDEMELRRALQEALGELAAETHKRASFNDFVSHVTHELRTPLTSIKGSMSLIENRVFGEIPKPMNDMVKVANKNVEKMMELINDLLDMRKMEAGKFTYEFMMVTLGDLLAEICDRMAGYGVDKNIRLTRDIQPLPAMPVDPDRLSQAIINLVSNAIKFSPKGEEVLLRARLEGETVIIDVIDRGAGIPDDLKPRLFGDYTQGKHKQTGLKGTGLGLKITKTIVEAHGGSIAFDSNEGAGTKFTITLPVRLQPVL